MSEENTGTTLRDALETSFEAIETPEQVAETAEAKAERLRDDQGRFAAETSVTQPVQQGLKPEDAPIVEKPRPQRPSSWKKDYWDHWDKLDPNLAEYLTQRESEFAKGVSTYKGEWERAKPLIDAIAPYQQVLQQYNIDPAKQISDLMRAHHALALGSPQEKQQMFMKLAQDYGVQLEGMPQQDPQQNYLINELNSVKSLVNNWQTAQEKAEQQRLQEEIEAFKGNPENVHFEQVKDTMAQLLASRVVPDLKTAYDQATWLNPDIRSQIIAKQQEDAEKERQAKIKAEANRAKANQVSVKSATPTTGSKEGKTGRRAALEEAAEEFLGAQSI